MNERYYTIAEVADILHTSQKAVRRHIAAFEIDHIKVGASYRIPVIAMNNFVNSRHNGRNKGVNYELFGNVIEKQKVKRPTGDVVNWADIEKYWESPTQSEMTFVDLFCGAGGLSKGLEMAGLQGICGLDWFEEAGMTYRRNFHHPFVNGDIKLPEKKQEFYTTVARQLNGRHLHVVALWFFKFI